MSIEGASQATSSDSGSSSVSDVSTSSSSVESSSSSMDTTLGDTGSEGVSATPAYSPNYQFKVYDKTHEFPEWVRSAITDKTREEEVRDVFSRAYGLDGVKSKFERLKSEYDGLVPYREKYDSASQQIQKLVTLRQHDFHGFVGALGLSDDQLIDYLTERAKLKHDPDFASDFNRNLDVRRQMLQAQETGTQTSSQLDALTEHNQQLQRQMHEFQLNTVYSRPDVKSFETQFDARMGEGSFRKAVRDHGSYVFHQTKQNLPPQAAIEEIIQKYRPLFGNAPEQFGAPAVTQTAPTIPNVGSGKSISPTKARFKSIDDIKKHYEANFGS